jgi:predicted nucleic acid-binding protein
MVSGFLRQASDAAHTLPEIKIMPIFSASVVLGSLVAASLAVSQYRPRKSGDRRGLAVKRLVLFATTWAPGCIFAQFCWGWLRHSQPELARIEGTDLLIGCIAGGMGRPVALYLYERLPSSLADAAKTIILRWAGVPPSVMLPKPSPESESSNNGDKDNDNV